jgi:hypothetical protein
MKTTLPTNRLPEMEVVPTANVAAPENLNHQLDLMKHRVFEQYQTALGANEPLLRLALIEADALARQTEYPHLVFPVLAEEKAAKAARWQFRQRFLLRDQIAFAA